jgi:hypothetical protein
MQPQATKGRNDKTMPKKYEWLLRACKHGSRRYQKQVRELLVMCAGNNSRQEPARTVAG